jgi:hypothetical protein
MDANARVTQCDVFGRFATCNRAGERGPTGSAFTKLARKTADETAATRAATGANARNAAEGSANNETLRPARWGQFGFAPQPPLPTILDFEARLKSAAFGAVIRCLGNSEFVLFDIMGHRG